MFIYIILLFSKSTHTVGTSENKTVLVIICITQRIILSTSSYAPRGLQGNQLLKKCCFWLYLFPKIFEERRFIFLWFSLGSVLVPSTKMAINLPRNNEKLQCKGEPDRFRDQRDSSVQTNRQTSCYYYKDMLE